MTGEDITLHDLAIGDAGWLIERHATAYAASDGFNASFEALVAEILAGFIRHRQPPTDRAWIARNGDTRLGSIFCVKEGTPGVAKLRLFYLEPEARGRGLGKRLLRACIDHATATGHHTLRLWTHESHRAACALYASHGFTCDRSRPVTSFGVDLIEQEWSLKLPL